MCGRVAILSHVQHGVLFISRSISGFSSCARLCACGQAVLCPSAEDLQSHASPPVAGSQCNRRVKSSHSRQARFALQHSSKDQVKTETGLPFPKNKRKCSRRHQKSVCVIKRRKGCWGVEDPVATFPSSGRPVNPYCLRDWRLDADGVPPPSGADGSSAPPELDVEVVTGTGETQVKSQSRADDDVSVSMSTAALVGADGLAVTDVMLPLPLPEPEFPLPTELPLPRIRFALPLPVP